MGKDMTPDGTWWYDWGGGKGDGAEEKGKGWNVESLVWYDLILKPLGSHGGALDRGTTRAYLLIK